MFSRKKVLAGALGAGLVIAIVSFPASSAVASPDAASPDAASGCHPATLSAPQPCISVTGSGLDIGTLSGWDINSTQTSWANLHIELTGPNGLIKNCPQFTLQVGYESPVCSWSPNHDEPAGTYGQTTWQATGTNSYRDVTGITVGVHS
jgi:hypothetical protein